MMSGQNLLFELRDYNGVRVYAEYDRWRRHVLEIRPKMADHIEEVRAAITTPVFVNADKEFPERCCLYGVYTSRSRVLMLKVVVEYDAGKGEVITAYPCEPGPVQESTIMDKTEFMIPAYDSLDPSKVEVYLDIDLDQFTVLFYGRDREHYAHPVNEILSYLLDVETDEVVGILLDRFTRQVVQEHPHMREDVYVATVLFRDFVGHISELEQRPDNVWGRFRHAARAARRAWDAESNQEPVRHMLNNLAAIA